MGGRPPAISGVARRSAGNLLGSCWGTCPCPRRLRRRRRTVAILSTIRSHLASPPGFPLAGLRARPITAAQSQGVCTVHRPVRMDRHCPPAYGAHFVPSRLAKVGNCIKAGFHIMMDGLRLLWQNHTLFLTRAQELRCRPSSSPSVTAKRPTSGANHTSWLEQAYSVLASLAADAA